MIREGRAAGLLLVAATVLFLAGLARAPEIFFDFGPNDSHHVEGFREDFEIDEPTLIHWTGTRATVTLPFHIRGPYEVRLRYKRHIAAPAELRFFLGGEPVETLVVPQGDFRLLTLKSPEGGTVGTFRLAMSSSSTDKRPMGIALDWMQVIPERRFLALVPRLSTFLWVLSWPLLFFAAARVMGQTAGRALAAGLLVAAGLAVAFAFHVNWPTYAAEVLGYRFLGLGLAIVLLPRLLARRNGSVFASDEARLAVLIVLAGTTFRLFLLFHPDFYYPDVRTHSKFVSLIWTEGLDGFFSDYIPNQHRHLLGLQYVGDRWLAFPYPPVLYLTVYPFSLLQLPVEEWMKFLPCGLLAFEALLLFALGQRLGLSRRAALCAAALHATAGVMGFRLAVASFAALFGHFWDTVVVVYLARFLDRMTEPRIAIGLYGLVTLSLMSYAGSALVLGFLMPLIAIALAVRGPDGDEDHRATRNRSLAIAGWSLAAAATAFFLFYAQYLPELFGASGEAGSLSAGGLVEPRFTPIAALRMSAYRLQLFYGLVFSVIGAAGLVALVRSRASRLAKSLAYAASGTYLGLNVLRAGLGDTHIFQFSKDDLVIAGLMVMLSGVLVDRLLSKGGAARLLGAGLLLLWVGWGAQTFGRTIRARFINPGYERAGWSGSPEDAVAARSLGAIESLVGELE